MRAHEVAWDPPPGAAPAPKVLRLDGDPDDRADIIKTLRLLEWQPETRRPFVIVEAPFADARSYLRAVVAQIAADVAAVDKGLAEDGIGRSAAPEPPAAIDAASALAFADRSAEHLADVLDGLVLVLAPKAVLDIDAFLTLVKELVSLRRGASAVRLDVLALTARKLAEVLPVCARFDVDRDALFDYLKELGPKPSRGPVDPAAPKLSSQRREQIEKELGQPLLSLDAGHTLKALMMDGARALSQGRPKEAVRKMRAARMLCESSGLVREGLIVTIGLGTAYVTAQNLKAADACYELARKRAAGAEMQTLEIQALFGLGQVRVLQQRFAEASPAFERIADLTPLDSPLHREALRMVEVCKRRDPRFGLPAYPAGGAP
jgi:hypothetical protein